MIQRIWDERAAEDKARYAAEMAIYVAPPGHDAHGNVLEDLRARSKARKKAKDKEAPKRARGVLPLTHDVVYLLLSFLVSPFILFAGPYVYFTQAERPRLMEEMPDLKFVQTGTILGERWRQLPAEEKRKYEEMASEDKVRFNREMSEYNAKKAAAMMPPAVPQQEDFIPADMAAQMQYDPTAYHQAHAYDQSAFQYH